MIFRLYNAETKRMIGHIHVDNIEDLEPEIARRNYSFPVTYVQLSPPPTQDNEQDTDNNTSTNGTGQ